VKEIKVYRITQTRSGHPTLLVSREGKEIPLHSSVDPLREAESMRDRFDPGRYDTLVVLGTGLAYHLLPLESMLDAYTSVFLIDILDGIRETVAEGAAAFLSRNHRVRFLTGLAPEEVAAELSSALDLGSTRGISVLEHPASMRIFPEYYLAVKKQIESVINKKAGNEATRKAFGVKYFRNILSNCAMAGEFMPVAGLFGRFKGCTAIIATSGPSLDRCLGIIREQQTGCCIIAADSALPVLERSGIRPDFTVSIDPQPYIYEHLMLSEPGRTVPVLSISASSRAFEWACRNAGKKDGMRFLSLNSHPLSQVIASLGGDFGSIESGTGNVAGDAVRMAILMGFDRIALAGFDFSFPRYAIYARGTAYQRRYGVYFQDRFSTVETRNAAYIFASSGGLKQQGLYTRKSFVQYRESLETLIGCGKTDIVSMMGEGLPISGAPAAGGEIFPGAPGTKNKTDILRSISAGRGPTRIAFKAADLKAALNNKTLVKELAAASAGGVLNEKKIEMMIKAFRRGDS